MIDLPDLDDAEQARLGASVPELAPIGYVRSARDLPSDTPIQSRRNPTEEACLVVFPHFAEGLDGLAGFDYAWVLSWLDRAPQAPGGELRVVPFLLRDRGERVGVFATRFPHRPNPVGLSLVRILGVEGNMVRFSGVDLCNGTPVLDIKPWERNFDVPPDHEQARGGWYERASEASRDQVLP
ncbi:MAG: tRNA (N6-threonylcarbamoyladenosine(37)-N6)-methyltransferase TrmO [Acidimicrobiales bacterium]